MSKKITKVISASILVIVLVFSIQVGYNFFKLKKASAAALTYPVQYGLNSVVMSPCVGLLVCPTPMCNAKHMGSCPPSTPVFWEITGVPAGGDGNMLVLSDVVTKKIGLIPGGSLIAGGIAPTMMDLGVAASVGGVAGNTAFKLYVLSEKAGSLFSNWF